MICTEQIFTATFQRRCYIIILNTLRNATVCVSQWTLISELESIICSYVCNALGTDSYWIRIRMENMKHHIATKIKCQKVNQSRPARQLKAIQYEYENATPFNCEVNENCFPFHSIHVKIISFLSEES